MIQVIVFLIRASLAAVLIAAGAAKLADTQSFTNTLVGLVIPIRPEYLIRGLGLMLPFVEVCVGIAVISGLWPQPVNVALLALMCSFSIVVIIALSKNLQVVCRCFGALSDSQFNGRGLVRSLFLTILAAIVFWSGNTYSFQYNELPGVTILLIAGFLIFAIATAQAAKTIAALKARKA